MSPTGLDYWIMRPVDRAMIVGAGDDRDRPTVDYLMNFTDYSVLVEIKRPDTPIFAQRRAGRSSTWRFNNESIDAVSQVLEQKAEWLRKLRQGRTTTNPVTEDLKRGHAIRRRYSSLAAPPRYRPSVTVETLRFAATQETEYGCRFEVWPMLDQRAPRTDTLTFTTPPWPHHGDDP